LWKQPHALAAALSDLVSSAAAFDELAVTMTGEMCDCFETRREGVHAILNAVQTAFPNVPSRIWRNDGTFVNITDARQSPYEIASANWLALATFAGRFALQGPALLIDIGSTTTDIIPLFDGKPRPLGRTDFERLQSGELLYRGVRRTPFPWGLRSNLAAELYATMLDAYLVTGTIAENPNDHGTADGRPATRHYAHARLARMLGTDGEICPPAATAQLAHEAATDVAKEIDAAMRQVCDRVGTNPQCILTSGSGEPVALKVIEDFGWKKNAVVSLKEQLGHELSSAACAYAVAVLALERDHGN
jgi:probable H4MPT-linked C1 transfer pathway protein